MSLTAGTRLGTYEIAELVGKGGMGEVYRARDTKLGRDVAIKLLPEAFSGDAERMKRFEREAQVLASLNHPNVATLFGLEQSEGRPCLVMELVEGETLEERLNRGRLDLEEALTLFEQVAAGVEAAHVKGIIHRDLKPANIKIRSDGAVKILDFGLAKALAEESTAADALEMSRSPTRLRQGYGGQAPDSTALGVILGTAPYMSPEQARGKVVDKRTDIWAFGVCLYEALVGRRAFSGDTVSDTIARILQTEPDFDALPGTAPAAVRRLLRRCLAKDPAQRVHDIADARLELDEAKTAPREDVPTSVPRSRNLLTPVLAAVVASVFTAMVFWSFSRNDHDSPPRPVTRAVLPYPPGSELHPTWTPSIAISPDGRSVAYRASKDGRTQIYLRSLDSLEGKEVDGSLGAVMPFFSPDGQWLGFQAGGKLVKVSVGGGAPVNITGVGDGELRGATWSSDGTVYFSRQSLGLFRVSADGGEPEPVTVPNRERNEKSHRYPRMLPGGKALLFTLGSGSDELFDDASTAVLSLETGEYHVILEGGTNPHYSPTGHIVYGRRGDLFAVPFDLESLRVTGGPVAVVPDVEMTPIAGDVEFDLSSNGTLVYTSGTLSRANRLVWADRSGREEPTVGDVDDFYNPSVSPDGRYLAVWVGRANNNIWVYELARGTVVHRLRTFDNDYPSWSPGSDRVLFTSNRDGAFNIYAQAVNGDAPPERLTTSPFQQTSPSLSPDERWLVYAEGRPSTRSDIWLLPLDGNGVPVAFVQSEFDEVEPQISPDGRFLAYQSNETGRDEIYIRSFPDGKRRWQVSTSGGSYPRWNPRGGELFYARGDEILVVPVQAGADPGIGSPHVVFTAADSFGQFAVRFAVAHDGKRLLVVERAAPDEPATELHLVTDWFEELKRLAPR